MALFRYAICCKTKHILTLQADDVGTERVHGDIEQSTPVVSQLDGSRPTKQPPIDTADTETNMQKVLSCIFLLII